MGHRGPWLRRGDGQDVLKASRETGLNWLEHSGLWENGQVRWGWRAGSFQFVYTEVTAYGLLLLLRLGPPGDRAEATARRLLDAQHSSGAFLHRPGADESFTFDTAICVAALAELAAMTGVATHRDAALKGGRWLLEAQKESGSFHARYVPSRAVFDQGDGAGTFWGDDSAIHAKVALAFLRCEELSRGEGFLSGARKVCDWVRQLQQADGRIRMSSGSRRTFLHAHCYATEGLLATAERVPSEESERAGRAAARWLVDVQRRDGGLPAWRGTWRRPTMAAVDATAQALRLWLVTDEEALNGEAVRRGARFLMGMQCRSGSRATRGAFSAAAYGIRPVLLRPAVFPAWSSIFAVHALHLILQGMTGSCAAREELF